MIGDNEAFDEFLSQHRWAVLTSLRKSGQPVSALVAYARDGGQLVVSTPGFTFRRRSVERDARVNLCVITNQEPFNYVAVEGLATVERENLVQSTKLIFANIAGTGHEEPEDLPAWLESEERIIVRIAPQRVHGVIR